MLKNQPNISPEWRVSIWKLFSKRNTFERFLNVVVFKHVIPQFHLFKPIHKKEQNNTLLSKRTFTFFDLLHMKNIVDNRIWIFKLEILFFFITDNNQRMFFIGASDIEGDNRWIWANSRKPVTSTYREHFNSTGGHCAAIIEEGRATFRLHNLHCDRKLRFICEVDKIY